MHEVTSYASMAYGSPLNFYTSAALNQVDQNASSQGLTVPGTRPIMPKDFDQILNGDECALSASGLNHTNVTPSNQTRLSLPSFSRLQNSIGPQISVAQREVGNPLANNPTPPLDRWQQARDYRRMVHQPPYIDPRTDHTIKIVESHAESWVSQLMSAMLNTSSVKDREGSHAKRVFLAGAYDPLLIESACREIFLSLLDRCRNGFRGPSTFNKALKPGRDMDEDRSATCQERLQNIVQVLMWNKRVCKDVLYEDWKIRLLVNHPLAYDKEKDNQKDSNDQRRARLVDEREKLRCTKEELREYQLAMTGQCGVAQSSTPQWNGGKRDRSEQIVEHEFESDLKRPRVES